MTPTLQGLTLAPVRPRQGRDGLVGFPVRRFHLRLFTVSRFAGLLPSLGPGVSATQGPTEEIKYSPELPTSVSRTQIARVN
jgi:hypothetical protein